MENEVKKTRKPRSEEAKQKQREKMLARAAANREKYGQGSSPEQRAKIAEGMAKCKRAPMSEEKKAEAVIRRQNNSKARNFIGVLYSLLLEIVQSEKDETVFAAFVAAYPEFKATKSKDGEQILIRQSVRKLRDDHGVVGERIWKKLFVCVQQGGYSMRTGESYDTIWRLNPAALDDYLIRRMNVQAKTGKPFTVSQALEVLADHEELKRVPTEHVIEQVEGGRMMYARLKVVGKQKMITTPAERAEIKERRAAVVEELAQHREQIYRELVDRVNSHA